MNEQSKKWELKKVFLLVFLLVIIATVIYSYILQGDPFDQHVQPQHHANYSESALPVVRSSGKDVDLHGVVSIFKPNQVLTQRYNDCAVVSSSGHMTKSKAGPEIDNTSCVIRMNDGPTKGFEADVGHGTTIRVIAHSSLRFVVKSKNQLLSGSAKPNICIIWGPEHVMRTNGGGIAYNIARRLALEFKDIEFYMLTQEQMDLSDQTFEMETGKTRQATGSWLSTGWFTMILAVNLCNSISVYGMVQEDHCLKSPKSGVAYHYYEPNGMKECYFYNKMEAAKKNRHRFALEKRIFAKWATVYNITFHHPEWKN